MIIFILWLTLKNIMVLKLLLAFVGVPFVIQGWLFSEKNKTYKLAQTNLEEYQRQVIREQDAEKAANQATIAWARERTIKPECPYCHSYNTTRITATAKAVNTAMFGVLGQKRNYQWHCNNCKSDF